MPGQFTSLKVKEVVMKGVNKAKEYNMPVAYADSNVNRVKYWIKQEY